MRPRDLDRLAGTEYELLVIGGGIHGLAIAYDAASRGIRTALIEAADFGSGTSFNHQKTIHGGLRSLQSARIGRAREAIRERRALARIAPWLLRPLPFLVGTYRSATRSRIALRVAFKIDEWLARKRNEGVEPELHLPRARLVSKAATLRLFPGIRAVTLTGGAQWYDYQVVEADRLTFAFAAAADRSGADLANYVEAVAAIKGGGSVAGVEARDRFTGERLPIRARVTVNAAGARAGSIMAAFGVTREFPLLKAINLVTSRRASDIALAAPSSSGRILTLVPWRGRALMGTGQSASLIEPGDVHVSAAEILAFIAEANEAFPGLALTPTDVTLVHRGAVPAVVGQRGMPDLKSEPEIYDHSSEGAPGAFTVVGVKYTTARGVAERVTGLVGRRLGRRIPVSSTATTTLPGAGIADHEALVIETARAISLDLPLPTTRHLIARYAEKGAPIVRLMAEREDLRLPVSPSVPTLGAEILYVIRNEMAVRLSDIVIRRTGLGDMGHPGDDAVHTCAQIAAAELGWSEAKIEDEIADVNDFYRIADR